MADRNDFLKMFIELEETDPDYAEMLYCTIDRIGVEKLVDLIRYAKSRDLSRDEFFVDVWIFKE